MRDCPDRQKRLSGLARRIPQTIAHSPSHCCPKPPQVPFTAGRPARTRQCTKRKKVKILCTLRCGINHAEDGTPTCSKPYQSAQAERQYHVPDNMKGRISSCWPVRKGLNMAPEFTGRVLLNQTALIPAKEVRLDRETR